MSGIPSCVPDKAAVNCIQTLFHIIRSVFPEQIHYKGKSQPAQEQIPGGTERYPECRMGCIGALRQILENLQGGEYT